MTGLQGKKVALAASRRIEEMSELVRKRGGIPIVHSIQSTVILDAGQVLPDLKRLVEEKIDWVILTTGIGTQTLLEQARQHGLYEQVLAVLRSSNIAARGYKTLNVLKQYGIKPVVQSDTGTVENLIRHLRTVPLSGCRVVVQLYGEKIPLLESFLREQGADYKEILPYQHIPPAEETVLSLIDAVMQQQVDAVAFTSAIQVRNLFDVAAKHGRTAALQEAFARHVVAVAVGSVTADTLAANGVERIVRPVRERMGAMIMALDKYFLETKSLAPSGDEAAIRQTNI